MVLVAARWVVDGLAYQALLKSRPFMFSFCARITIRCYFCFAYNYCAITYQKKLTTKYFAKFFYIILTHCGYSHMEPEDAGTARCSPVRTLRLLRCALPCDYGSRNLTENLMCPRHYGKWWRLNTRNNRLVNFPWPSSAHLRKVFNRTPGF